MPNVSKTAKNASGLKEVARQAGIPYTTFLHRVRAGKSIVEASRPGQASKSCIEIAGVHYESIKAASDFYGVNPRRISWRLANGWSPEEAVGLACRRKQSRLRRPGRQLMVEGKMFRSITEAAAFFGVSRALLANRLRSGLTPEQALELKPFPSWFIPGKGQVAKAKSAARRLEEQRSGFKVCQRCGERKPLDHFHKAKADASSHRCKACTALALIKSRYGISEPEFHALRRFQGGRCAICECDLGLSEKTVSRRQTVAVDHCHKTGFVRGLLCNCCNAGIGSLGDDPDRLAKAITYLEQASQGSPALVARSKTAGL